MLVEEAPEEHSLVDGGECKGSGGREREEGNRARRREKGLGNRKRAGQWLEGAKTKAVQTPSFSPH